MSSLFADNNAGAKLIRFTLVCLRMAVLAAAVLLIFIITKDTFENISFLVDPRYLKFQFWICVIFMIEIAAECIFGKHDFKHLMPEILFFFLCIPFVNIIDRFGIKVSGEMLFVLRVLPMLRAAYIVVQVTTNLHADRVTGLFRAYITLFIVVVYFSSLMFYVEEHPVNNSVDTYWSALWWTVMTLTTAGCYITEITTVGKVLSVILSGGGLILFPVFTIYVSNAVSGGGDSTGSEPTPDGNTKIQTENASQVGNNTNFAEKQSSTN